MPFGTLKQPVWLCRGVLWTGMAEMILPARIERPQSYRGGSASGEIRSATTVETDLLGCLSLPGVTPSPHPLCASIYALRSALIRVW